MLVEADCDDCTTTGGRGLPDRNACPLTAIPVPYGLRARYPLIRISDYYVCRNLTIPPFISASDHGDHLRKAQNFTGMPQAVAAKRLGISKNALSNCETGNRSPNGRVIKAIAILYECSPNFLIAITDHFETIKFEL